MSAIVEGSCLDDTPVQSRDDVVVCTKTGEVSATQVKFSAHPNRPGDPYDWDDLLKQEEGETGSKKSLLQKWAWSYNKLKQSHPSVECTLVSNRRPSDNLYLALPDWRQLEFPVNDN